MYEIIEQILEGNFDHENGSLDFSCLKLELTLHRGEVCEGSFMIRSTPGHYTEGYVRTTDLRMECLTPYFSGESEEISYCFHGEYMEAGDVVKGNFCIVSNQGEYYLPFVVSVEHDVLESSVGSIKNLFHFTNLAKSDWQEAVKLFYSPEFVHVLEGSDSQFYDVYRGLSVYPGQEQNLEEFLIQINKKQRADFIVQEEALVLERASGILADNVTELELNIVRNGWGYTALQVECEGDFVFTERELLTDNDFLGNRCTLPVFIDAQLCRTGRNFGKIYIYNSYVSLTIPVTVQLGNETAANHARLAYKKNLVQLMRLYCSFRLKKTGMSVWLKETGKLIESLTAMDENDVAARLFQAQLLISSDRYNEAEWTLDIANGMMEKAGGQDDTLEAYYLYLTTLIRRKEADYVAQAAAAVEQIYKQDKHNWRVAWLLLYLSDDYGKAAPRWDLLEKQFAMGCRSPILYIEALHILNGNPAFLRKLNEYTLHLLWFGAREGALKPEVTEQLLYLTGKARGYMPLLLKILTAVYEENKDERFLQEICTLLIRGNRIGSAYFPWYEAGVEAQLRITNLYEYYMMSLEPDTMHTLPKTVLLYFSYRSNLDYERTAFLYAYVIRIRAELPELYENYRQAMENFVVDQIRRDHINRYLAEIYQELLTPEMIDGQTAEHLAGLLFAHQLTVEDERLKKVIVYHPGNLHAAEYDLQDGRTWVALYGNDHTILFEDAYGNRFAKSAKYMLERLMIPGKNLRLIENLVQDSLELDLYLCERGRMTDSLTGEEATRAARIVRSDRADEDIRKKLYLKLLRYYYDADEIRELDTSLENLPEYDFSMEERGEILHYLVLRGKLDAAWAWVKKFGPYFVEKKVLMRLVSGEAARDMDAEDPCLIEAAHYVLQCGKYDGRILQYLVEHLEGTTKELRNLWKAARSFDLDCYRLSEHILTQIMYSGAYVGEKMEIFRYYVSQGANPQVENAFLVQCSYDFFVKERMTDSLVFAQIHRLYTRGEPLQRICRLAFLKYYGENVDEINGDILVTIGDFLEEMLKKRIYLNVFRSFEGMDFPQAYLLREMQDKTIVEYCAHPGAHARIHYVIMRGDEKETEYLTEPMREIYGGVCFKDFILFFGENLQYYIVEEADGEEQLTESGTLQGSDTRGESEGGRYEMINDIAISGALEDYDTFDKLVEEYYHREYLAENLFVLQ